MPWVHANYGWYGSFSGGGQRTQYESSFTSIEIKRDEKGLSDLIHEFYKKEYELVVRNQELKTIELEKNSGGPVVGAWREDFLKQVKAASKPNDHVGAYAAMKPDINPVIMD